MPVTPLAVRLSLFLSLFFTLSLSFSVSPLSVCGRDLSPDREFHLFVSALLPSFPFHSFLSLLCFLISFFLSFVWRTIKIDSHAPPVTGHVRPRPTTSPSFCFYYITKPPQSFSLYHPSTLIKVQPLPFVNNFSFKRHKLFLRSIPVLEPLFCDRQGSAGKDELRLWQWRGKEKGKLPTSY